MTLTLRIRNVDRLDNGAPTELSIDHRGAVIGRTSSCDWSLPDPRSYISSRHAEITFRDGAYQFNDISTNGTYLNGSDDRMAGPRRIETGDVFLIGHYEVEAAVSAATVGAVPAGDGWGAAPPPPPAGDGWGAAPAQSAQPGASSEWGAAPNPPAPAAAAWGAPPAAAAPVADSGWATAAPTPPPPPPPPPPSPPAPPPPPPPPPPPAPAPPSPAPAAAAPVQQASAWATPAADGTKAQAPSNIWGSMEQSNVVDWGRAFGDKGGDAKESRASDKKPADASVKSPAPAQTAPGATPAPVAEAPAASDLSDAAVAFGKAAGLKPEQLKEPSAETIERAAIIMRRLVSGLVVMVEARARAKSQMGAEATGLEFDGNNPIKFARTPDQALAQLLNPPERGFMTSEKAVEDAYFDLQSHQMATLKAMQGALRATLDRFSPAAIKRRAETGGFLSRILPGGREATLWHTYEREFSGVSQGSDEAFMDVFAKEFRLAYEDLARNRNR